MKRVLLLTLAALCLAAPFVQAQTPEAAAAIAERQAEEERYKRLSSQLEDLQAMIVQQNRKIEELASQLSNLRDAHSRAEGRAASMESLKQIVDDIQEVDKKRIADNKLIREELTKIAKVVAEAPAPTRNTRTKPDSETRTTPPPEREPANTSLPQNGYEYPVEKGDTLSTIAAKYRTQGIKVSVDDILKANPGLRPEKLSVGQKLFIPQPKG